MVLVKKTIKSSQKHRCVFFFFLKSEIKKGLKEFKGLRRKNRSEGFSTGGHTVIS